MFKKLRTIIYSAKDHAATKEWYIQATGIQPYFDEPFYVGFDINSFELGNQTVSYWLVDDVQTTSRKLVAFGAALVQPKTSLAGIIHIAAIADPLVTIPGLLKAHNHYL